jgi:hypothetical protein
MQKTADDKSSPFFIVLCASANYSDVVQSNFWDDGIASAKLQ